MQENKNLCLEFISTDAYNQLLLWFDYTGWRLDDFNDVISLTDLDVPIKINDYTDKTFICKDSNDKDFFITIGYNFKDNSTYHSIYKDKKTIVYRIPNKSRRNQKVEKIFLVEETDNNIMHTKIFKKTIIKTIKLEKSMYKICLVSKFNELFEKLILNLKNIDSSLLEINSKLSAIELLPIIFEKTYLSNEDLKKINLSLEIVSLENNITSSKVRLQKNSITDARFTVNKGFLDIYENGKLTFTSTNQNIILTINNIADVTDEDISSLTGYDKKSIQDLLNTIKQKF